MLQKLKSPWNFWSRLKILGAHCGYEAKHLSSFFSILRSTMRNWSQGALRWKKPCGGGVNAQQIGEINGVKLEQNETNLRTN